jgi:hypothetical protein
VLVCVSFHNEGYKIERRTDNSYSNGSNNAKELRLNSVLRMNKSIRDDGLIELLALGMNEQPRLNPNGYIKLLRSFPQPQLESFAASRVYQPHAYTQYLSIVDTK